MTEGIADDTNYSVEIRCEACNWLLDKRTISDIVEENREKAKVK